MRTLKEIWDSFAEHYIPEDADPTQYEEMRKAFYAGSYSILLTILEISKLPSSEKIVKLSPFYQECSDFFKELEKKE
jgi:hypothetical protein